MNLRVRRAAGRRGDRFTVPTPVYAGLIFLGAVCTAPAVLAQGQDSTPGERWVRVMGELLPGTWDNANQAYFDRRRKLPEAERHERVHLVIERVQAPALGEFVFLWEETRGGPDAPRERWRIVTLEAEDSGAAVLMRHRAGQGERPADPGTLGPADLSPLVGCELRFRRRAGGFRGEMDEGACRAGAGELLPGTLELSSGDLFMHPREPQPTGREPDWLERARRFHCYADVPGVGGGRDEPFERYDGMVLHDKGGSHWFTAGGKDPRRLGISLLAVTWPILNEDNGNFNRDSLVIYVSEKLAEGSTVEHGYAFTEPSAERIGINLKWMLVNCSLVPPAEARPAL